MPEAPPEADLPLAEDQPSAEAAGYLFIPLTLTLSPSWGRGDLCGTPWQDHGEIYFIILGIMRFTSFNR